MDGSAEGRISDHDAGLDPPVDYTTQRTGSLIVITGSMFSGKTEELIRRVRRALYARRSVQVFKHAIDTRSETTEIRSHNGVPHEATAVSTSEELLAKVEETTNVVAIEEAQFFDEGIVEAAGTRRCGKRGNRGRPRHGLSWASPSGRCRGSSPRPTRW